MFFKLAGISLIFLAGYLAGLKIMEPSADYIRILEEGNLLFRILESEMRNTKTPLPVLFHNLSGKTETKWRVFFFVCRKFLRKDVRIVFQTYTRLFYLKQ